MGYWVRGNKLDAHRVGKQYSISAEALVLYLKSKGQEIPDELAGVDEGDLPGMGIEQIFLPDSLPMIVAGIKKRSLEDPSMPQLIQSIFQE